MKKGNLIVIVIFLAVIAVPAVMMFQGAGKLLPGENRMAAPLPTLIKEDGSTATRTELEGFANDNIGFRTAAPDLDARLMYKVFHIILDTAQLQGKAGNLFPGGDRHFPSGRAPYPPLSEEELSRNAVNIEAAADYFASRDIPFLFITIPDKEEVYPELYPDSFLKKPGRSRLSEQAAWMTANTGVDAYDMTQALRDAAQTSGEMLWYETADAAHWNYMGAYYGYLEIMRRLQKYDPSRKVLSLDDFEITVTKEPYTNWDKSFVFEGMFNTVYKFDYKPGWTGVNIGNGDDPWMPADQLDIAGFQKGGQYYHYHNSTQEGQLVFFGDSYVYQFLLPYFAESYADVYLFHLPTNYRIMKPVLDMIGADYIVLEMVERTYDGSNFSLMAEEFAAESPVLTAPGISQP